jgi:hypothetical protein
MTFSRIALALTLCASLFTLNVHASDESPLVQARSLLTDRASDLNLLPDDIADFEITDDYRSRHTGVRHLWLRQRIDGLPVALGLINMNLAEDGRVWSIHSRFADRAHARKTARQPTLSARAAVAAYADRRRLPFDESIRISARQSDEAMRFHGGRMSDSDIPVHLSWIEHQGELRLAWEMVVDERGRSDWYQAWIDAHSGDVLNAVNWTQDVAYRVFAAPLEHPGQGGDTLETDPADPTASPNGWHRVGTTAYTDTRGNNVFAQEDSDANNTGGRRPDGGQERIFDFPIDLDRQQPADYEDFAITNLFYWNNYLHDVLWHHGFDEAAGNFQQVNFSGEGQGGDAVRADAQDGSGTNNANFGTPPDGFAPRMQMFVWTDAPPAQLRIEQPAVIAGDYRAQGTNWGEPLNDPGLQGTLELVNDGSESADLGCDALTGFTAGRIAMVRRGSCEFGTKALNAQNAGAIALVVVNNVGGNGTIAMGAGVDGPSVTIPVAMVGNEHGDLVIARLQEGVSATLLQEAAERLDRDSDLDALVIAHEYGHGLSNRLTGGPSQAACLSGLQQGGEGWSDFLGLWMTAKASDSSDQPRGIGSWLIFQENTPGAGIRPAPYIRDMSINPLTYGAIRTAGLAGGVSVPHGVGTVLNSAMWDMYWNLVDKYGFDEDRHTGSGGNNLALQLVVDGLKLQPCLPSFIDFRDAVLLADTIANDSANQCEIWDAFARRGMGIEASDAGGADARDVLQDFKQPSQCRSDPLYEDRFEVR